MFVSFFNAITADREKDLRDFISTLNITFNNIQYLDLALTHTSFSNENLIACYHNERLEFLGDSVLGLVSNSYLFHFLSEGTEGELAKIKSYVVSEESLAEIALKIGLDQFLLIGKGEERSGGRLKKVILADALEAFFGAYYLDSGLDKVQDFIIIYIKEQVQKYLDNKHNKDYKTLLQELSQKEYKIYPVYELIFSEGPEHAKVFHSSVKIGSLLFGPEKGNNKKEAEQRVAALAYNYIIKNKKEP